MVEIGLFSATTHYHNVTYLLQLFSTTDHENKYVITSEQEKIIMTVKWLQPNFKKSNVIQNSPYLGVTFSIKLIISAVVLLISSLGFSSRVLATYCVTALQGFLL